MILISVIAIILTIVAWLRGWKWKALCPLIIAGAVCFATEKWNFLTGDLYTMWVVVFWLIAALILMCIINPRSKVAESSDSE